MSLYKFARNILTIIFKLIYRVNIYNIDNIPLKGNIIICSNHISNLDPITLAVSVPRQVHFMAKKELFKNKLLGRILKEVGAFPVDRQGTDLSAIKKSLKVLKDDNALGIFPEGTRVKKKEESKVKPGIAMISIKSKSPIIPIYIKSTYKLFTKIDVFIGSPIDLSNYKKSKLNIDEYKSLSNEVMDKIYKLNQS